MTWMVSIPRNSNQCSGGQRFEAAQHRHEELVTRILLHCNLSAYGTKRTSARQQLVVIEEHPSTSEPAAQRRYGFQMPLVLSGEAQHKMSGAGPCIALQPFC